MKPLVLIASVGLLSAVVGASGAGVAPPFAFLEPTVRVTSSDRARLDTGDVIAHVLPADDGHIAFFAAAVTSLLAIAPFGVGSGLPATLIMALGATALWREPVKPRAVIEFVTRQPEIRRRAA